MKKSFLFIILFILFPNLLFAFLAKVNDEVIEVDDFKNALSDFHLLMQMRGRTTAGKLNLDVIENALQRMIENYLIAQEAKRLGLDKEPDYLNAIEEYKRNLCLDALWEEELKDITITDEELRKIYRERNTKIHVYQIFTRDKKKAEEALKRIKAGEEFKEVAKKFSEDPQAAKGGDLGFIPLERMPEKWKKTVFSLSPGEISDIIEADSGFYIIKLVEIKKPDMAKFEKVKKSMRRKLLKEKKKVKREELINNWRKKAKVKVNKDLLEKLDPEREIQGIIAWVNGEPIYVKEFLPILKRKLWGYQAMQRRWDIKVKMDDIKKEVLEELIKVHIAEQEALSRSYLKKDKKLKRKLKIYEISLLVNEFKRKIVAPQITVTEEEMKKYYERHKKEKYMSPAKYYIRLIKVSTAQEAEDIHEELLAGADFALLAKKKSKSDSAKKGGLVGWISEDKLPESIRKVIKTLKPGEISPVIEEGRYYSIILLEDKKFPEPLPFKLVKKQVKKDIWVEKFNKFVVTYLNELKRLSKIKIDKEALEKVNKELVGSDK
ncbi:MAG: peptidylprolyl isomerase [Candidatus Desulfofervidus auxilii]|nr:peptidylprolyl isomerase [Candidatus Desulfofervidus auxilii]